MVSHIQCLMNEQSESLTFMVFFPGKWTKWGDLGEDSGWTMLFQENLKINYKIQKWKLQYGWKCPYDNLSEMNIGCEINDFIHGTNRDNLEKLAKK